MTILWTQSRFIERRNKNEARKAHVRLADELRRSLIEDCVRDPGSAA